RSTAGRIRCSTCGATTRSSPATPQEAFDAVEADKTHRQHAVIENVPADLKNSALAPHALGALCCQRRLEHLRDDRLQPHAPLGPASLAMPTWPGPTLPRPCAR